MHILNCTDALPYNLQPEAAGQHVPAAMLAAMTTVPQHEQSSAQLYTLGTNNSMGLPAVMMQVGLQLPAWCRRTTLIVCNGYILLLPLSGASTYRILET